MEILHYGAEVGVLGPEKQGKTDPRRPELEKKHLSLSMPNVLPSHGAVNSNRIYLDTPLEQWYPGLSMGLMIKHLMFLLKWQPGFSKVS